MKTKSIITALLLALPVAAAAREYHVSPDGLDSNAGTPAAPLRTIQAAARKAMAGDTVTVHAGTYRERVDPLNGGTGPDRPILYRAAEGEKVELKGSEPVKGWKRDGRKSDVWKVVLPNSMFGSYNPYQDEIVGDWFYNHGRTHHTGDVYLNDVSLYEMDKKEKLYTDTVRSRRDPQGSRLLWYAEVDGTHTTLYANFGGADPNRETVEIAVRPTCFYPSREGVNYLILRGFYISQAATQWAAPTAEQVGMVATHWSKGWIIENNVIRNSRCNGISLGKERSTGHNLDCNDPRLDGTAHYREVIFNTLRHGWSRENVGSHIVRNNVISDCEQTAICGSMGAAFSEIYGNHIYNIWVKGQFSGQEMAGIKFHGAVDTHIHHNRIHHVGNYGMWLDWMTQGTRVSSNLFYDNGNADLFVEVSHGPYLVDNNLFLSNFALFDFSDAGAYVHNLLAGFNYVATDDRYTPYQLAHSTEIKGVSNIINSDNRFYNNIFVGKPGDNHPYGTCAYDSLPWPIHAAGNFYCNGARTRTGLADGLQADGTDPKLTLKEEADGHVYLSWQLGSEALDDVDTQLVTTRLLGTTRLSDYPYENPDGSPLTVDCDYWGNKRSESRPTPGPFEQPASQQPIKVW